MDLKSYYCLNQAEKPLDNLVEDGGFVKIFRKIAYVGDSLSSGEFEAVDANGKRSYHDMFEYSWGQYISRSCGNIGYNFRVVFHTDRFCIGFLFLLQVFFKGSRGAVFIKKFLFHNTHSEKYTTGNETE